MYQVKRFFSKTAHIMSTKWAVPFPRRIRELDSFGQKILSCGADLTPDHPGFTDPVYCERRKYFADLALNYKLGQPLPILEYTDAEVKTWGFVYKKLTKLYPTHASREFNHYLKLFVDYCDCREDNIPQLGDFSNFLKDSTGFTLRPVAGLLSFRDFFAGLAFRLIHCTLYIRPNSTPHYSTEPDVCHEYLGHGPMFADPAFAQFAEEIGLASLGASEEYLEKLTTLFWFTLEYGFCREDGKIKAYGGSLLSSFGELEHCFTKEHEFKEFDPEAICEHKYNLTAYQPQYYVSNTYHEARERMIKFCNKINPRPFGVRYNPYTQSIDTVEKYEI